MKKIKEWAENLTEAVEKVFFGKEQVIKKVLTALLCRGHVLLEDVPGVGKTILARALASRLGGKFSRVQCTPDLLPADILGMGIYNPKEGVFQFKEGPILSNIVLVDEINRATPRTQSALLEAMAENQISVEGKTIPLPEPFFLMATENPVEFEGTFPLPEAQKDRFFLSINIGYPQREQEKMILNSQRRLTHPVEDLTPVTDLTLLLEMQKQVVQIHVDSEVENYILDIIEATRQSSHFQLGASPRGALALYKAGQASGALDGRDYVLPEDIKEMAPSVLCKRVILKSESLFKGYSAQSIIEDILNNIPIPLLGKDK